MLFPTLPVFASEIWTSYTDTAESDAIQGMAIQGEYVWIATTRGAIRMNRSNGSCFVFHRADGLAGNVVNAVAVDSNGAVWFGTSEGLSRFDGSNWRTWTTTNGLANNVVSGVAFDSSGKVWITMNGGGIENKDSFNWAILQSYDGKSFVTHSSGKSYMSGGFSSLTIDPVHQWIWTRDGHGSFWFDPISSQYKWYYSWDGYPGAIPSAFDSGGTAWFVEKGQYRTFDGTTWSNPAPADTTLTGSLLSMVLDRHGIAWFAASKGMARFDGATWSLFTPDRFPDENPTRLFAADDDGGIWGVSHSGITRFDGNRFTSFSTSVRLPGNSIRSLAVDRDNVKWFGLDGSQGVSSFDGAVWRNYTMKDGLAMESIGDGVYAIAVDSTNVKWFGTWAGVTRFDGTNWTSYTKELSGVMTLTVDEKNVLWAGMFDGSMMAYDGTTWTNRNPGTSRVNFLAAGSGNRIWAGSEDYLFLYDGNWSHVTSGPPHYCGALLVDRANTLWVASGSGSPTGTTRFRNGVWEPRVPLPQPIDAPVHGLAEDVNGVIWAAASGNGNFGKRGQGAASFDGKTWTAYTAQNSGLVDNGVWAVAVDRDDVKWFATEGGVSSLRDTPDERFIKVTSPAGGEQWNAGTLRKIFWQVKGISLLRVEYSSDGIQWKTIADSLSTSSGCWNWPCFETATAHARLRFSETGNISMTATSAEFTVLPPLYATDKGTWTFFRYPPPVDSIINKEQQGSLTITAIATDHDSGVWIGASDSNIWHFSKNTWTRYDPMLTGFKGNITAIHVDINKMVWFSSEDGDHLRCFDGTTWKSVGFFGLLAVYDIAEDHNGVLWFAHKGGAIQLNPDGSSLLYSKWLGQFNHQTALSVAIDKNNVKWFGLYDLKGGDLRKQPGDLASFDGATWTIYSDSTKYHAFAGKAIDNVAIGADNSVYFSSYNGDVFNFSNNVVTKIYQEYFVDDIRSDANGDLWMIIQRNKPNPGRNEIPFYFSIRWDAGANHADFDSNESLFDWFTCITVDDKNAKWFATHYGLWRFENASSPTLATNADKPAAFNLLTNYPNPFNPSTTISFTLPASGKASLTVYDITGRRVRELLSGSVPAGAGTAVWDGKDDSGRPVSSGVYIARLSAGKNVAVGKMLLVK